MSLFCNHQTTTTVLIFSTKPTFSYLGWLKIASVHLFGPLENTNLLKNVCVCIPARFLRRNYETDGPATVCLTHPLSAVTQHCRAIRPVWEVAFHVIVQIAARLLAVNMEEVSDEEPPDERRRGKGERMKREEASEGR